MPHSIDTDSDYNIYVNVTFDHNPSDGNGLTPAIYKVTKTIPILDKADQYFCSVIRFDIPLNEVPIFICPIVPNSGFSQTTPLIIGIRTGGVNYPTNLVYVPNNNVSPVNQTNPNSQIISPFYYCFTYQIMINMINTALLSSFTASGLSGNSPYLFYDPKSQLISLIVDISNFAPTQTTVSPPVPTATIFFNSELLNYIEALPVNFLGYNLPQGRNFEFNLIRFGNDITLPPFSVSPTQKIFTQEYNVLYYWNSLRKIVVTSNSIPITPEFTPSNSSGISSTLPIITDFVPSLELAGQSRSVAYYTPSSQYRLIDLNSNLPIYNIDLNIYWQDKFSNLYPLYISVFQQASIKLGFFKKSLYKSGILPLKN